MRAHGLDWDDWLHIELFKLGNSVLTPASLLSALVSLLVLLLVSRWIDRWLFGRLLARSEHIDLSTRRTIATLVRWFVLTVGIVSILNGLGLQLSSFTMLAGALGVGIGFGLQNIFSNFISGLIVMFERPVKLGDHVVVGGVEGDVVSIGARATTLLTPQNTRVIIPNQSFITGNVVNWTLRPNCSVMVLSLRLSGDPASEAQGLIEAARGVQGVLASPAPEVYVTAIDHNGRSVELRYYASGNATERARIGSEVSLAVLAALQRAQGALAPNP